MCDSIPISQIQFSQWKRLAGYKNHIITPLHTIALLLHTRYSYYNATGAYYNLEGKFRADGHTGPQLRRYTSSEDPWNNLGPSTTRELREPRTRTVNLGITPCGLETPRARSWLDRMTFLNNFPERAPDFQSRPGAGTDRTWRVNIESNSQLNFNGHGYVLCGSSRATFKQPATLAPTVAFCPRGITFDDGVTRSIMDNNYVIPGY